MDFENYDINLFNQSCIGIDQCFQKINKIFVCRSPITLMSSFYCYVKRCNPRLRMSFNDFVNSHMHLWTKFMNHFIKKREEYDLLIVTFIEVLNEPEKVLQKINNKFNKPMKKNILKRDNRQFNRFAMPIHQNIRQPDNSSCR